MNIIVGAWTGDKAGGAVIVTAGDFGLAKTGGVGNVTGGIANS